MDKLREEQMAELQTIINNHNYALLVACEKVNMAYFGCDTVEHLADKIIELKAKLQIAREALIEIKYQKYDPQITAVVALAQIEDK